ncbi:MAG: oligosaccharide repeat unit polymerase [Lachnospiraceae bacterium]|nr:oligosaccharide repeat unit polymerase [Lachnospiraceae bacterium]
MDVFFVFLLLFTEIILFGIAYIQFNGDFISPSIVTLALFILSTACFAYNTNDWEVVFTLKAYLLFILSFILMIMTESWVSKNKVVIRKRWSYSIDISKKENTKKFILYIPAPFDTLLLAFFSGCVVYYVYRVYQSGMRLGATSFLSSIGYNKEKGDYDSLSRLLYNLTRVASYVYIIIFCNNVLGFKENIRKNWKSLLIIIQTILITFFSGQRSSSICYIFGIIVACGIALYEAQKGGQSINVKKFLKNLVIVAIIVVIIFYLSSNIVKGTSIKRRFIDYMTYYFGSTTALMGKIVEDPSLCHTPFAGYFGEKTFNGFWSFLNARGILKTPPTERVWIKMGGSIATQAGNEYTFFCAPYIDFGFIGTLVFIVVFYASYSYLYYWKIRRKLPSVKKCTTCAIYIFLYAMVAMSFYQDTIRSYSRPINIVYIIYIIIFCKLFVRLKK